MKIDESSIEPIVEGILFPLDYAILVAKEKMGKSLIAMQLACNLSSGTPFLGILEIPKPQRVWYFVAEGKDNEMKDRLIRMTKKVPINPDNFTMICSAGFKLNTTDGLTALHKLIEKHKNCLPQVIILDPLYMLVRGSIKDDDIINDFTQLLKRLSETCQAAIILIHHSKRPFRLQDGTELDLGDDAVFGSAFLKASADHVFYMGEVVNTNHLFIKCETQRSGNIIDTLEIRLNEPDPLYFEEAIRTDNTLDSKILQLLESKKELTVKEITKLLDISRQSFYNVLSRHKDKLIKNVTRPVKYSVKMMSKED